MSSIPRWLIWTVGVFCALLVLFFIFYLACLNHTSINQIGVCYNSLDGTIWTQMQPGWYVTSPFVQVAYITTLPVRVTIPSDAKVIVTKLVRFNPAGLDEFIRLQGFSYFQNIENTFLGFAFSENTYSFLEIIQEANQENKEGLLPLYKEEKK